ncbi:MAG: ribosome small subunit-dependent GTPase A [Coriobacteriia bacterium]
MSDALAEYGYSDRWHALFDSLAEPHHIPGRVIRTDRGSSLVITPDGVVRAEPASRLRRESHPEDLPVTGDWLLVDPAPTHEFALIDAVLPRSSAFLRGAAGTTSQVQVLAANVDTVFVIAPIDEEPNLRRIERELALAWESGAVPVVVLSKADLSPDPAGALESVQAIAVGADVLLESALTGEGVEALREYARGGRTVALIGPSGVGKSTLINALVGTDVQATREVRVSDGRGRHTTVSRELVPLPGDGVLMDTPGIREIALTDAEDGIETAFADIAELALGCRFADCKHEAEPGCAVIAAIETGELPLERMESYRKLVKEARSAAIRSDARLAAEERNRWKTIHKSMKDHPKFRHGT